MNVKQIKDRNGALRFTEGKTKSRREKENLKHEQ